MSIVMPSAELLALRAQGPRRTVQVRPTNLRLPDLFRGMNKLERLYATSLEAKRRAGQLVLWRYERLTLKLADDTRYTPDFYVLENDGQVSLTEVKGFMREDALVKLKVAATEFPEFRFYLFQKGVTKPIRGIP